MEQALIVGNQVLLILLYIIVGVILHKAKVVSDEGGTAISRFTLILVTPAVIINSFQRELEAEHLRNLAIVFGLAVLTHIISMGIAHLFIRKRPDARYRVERFGVSFANSGYMAIPLVAAVLGDIGVYYLSVFLGVFNLFTWTLGLSIIRKDYKISPKSIVLNPGIIGLVIGLSLHLLQLKIPGVLGTAVKSVSDMNTPLSMIVAGVFLAKVNLKEMLTNIRLYYVSFLKLFAVPLAVGLLLWILRIPTLSGGYDMVMTVILACACPAAGMTVQFTAQYLPECSGYAAEVVALTTALSAVSLPIVSYLVQFIF